MPDPTLSQNGATDEGLGRDGSGLRCPVCGFEDVGEAGTCRRGHVEVEMNRVEADDA